VHESGEFFGGGESGTNKDFFAVRRSVGAAEFIAVV